MKMERYKENKHVNDILRHHVRTKEEEPPIKLKRYRED